MMWPFKRRKKSAAHGDTEDQQLAAMAHPPITLAAYRAALDRVRSAQSTYPPSAIHIDDVRAVQGYTLVIKGYDAFGWPKGHPDSPMQNLGDTNTK